MNGSKFPAWISAIAPANSLQMEEEAWNAYPRCKTGILSSKTFVFFWHFHVIHVQMIKEQLSRNDVKQIGL